MRMKVAMRRNGCMGDEMGNFPVSRWESGKYQSLLETAFEWAEIFRVTFMVFFSLPLERFGWLIWIIGDVRLRKLFTHTHKGIFWANGLSGNEYQNSGVFRMSLFSGFYVLFLSVNTLILLLWLWRTETHNVTRSIRKSWGPNKWFHFFCCWKRFVNLDLNALLVSILLRKLRKRYSVWHDSESLPSFPGRAKPKSGWISFFNRNFWGFYSSLTPFSKYHHESVLLCRYGYRFEKVFND